MGRGSTCCFVIVVVSDMVGRGEEDEGGGAEKGTRCWN